MWAWILRIAGKLPRRLIGYALAAVAVAAAAWWLYDAGYEAAAEECKQRNAEARAQAIDQYHEALQADREYMAPWWEEQRETRNEARVIEREVIRYVERNPDSADAQCLEPDGRLHELWNAANRGALDQGDSGSD
jgi:hypothetical protein